MDKFFKNLRKLLKIISKNKISSKHVLERKSHISGEEMEDLLHYAFAEELIRTRDGKEYYITTKGRREHYALWTTRSGKFWSILSVVIAIIFFIVGTLWGPNIYDDFHGREGIVISPPEIEYLCSHNWTKGTIALINYGDFPIEDYPLAFSWPIEEEVSIEKDYIEGSQNPKVLEMDFEYGDTMKKVFIIPSIEPREVLSIGVIITSSCENNFDINVGKSPVIVEEFFGN